MITLEDIKSLKDDMGLSVERLESYAKGSAAGLFFFACLLFFCGHIFYAAALFPSSIFEFKRTITRNLLDFSNFKSGSIVLGSIFEETSWLLVPFVIVLCMTLTFYHVFINFLRVLLSPFTYLKALVMAPKEDQEKLIEGVADALGHEPTRRRVWIYLQRNWKYLRDDLWDLFKMYLQILSIDTVLLVLLATGVLVAGLFLVGGVVGWSQSGATYYSWIVVSSLILTLWSWVSFCSASNLRWARSAVLVMASSTLLLHAAVSGLSLGSSTIGFWRVDILHADKEQLKPLPGSWVLLLETDQTATAYDLETSSFLTLPKRDDLALRYLGYWKFDRILSVQSKRSAANNTAKRTAAAACL